MKWWGCGCKGPCIPHLKHVTSTSVWCEHRKAMYLFHVTPCYPFGTFPSGTEHTCLEIKAGNLVSPGVRLPGSIHWVNKRLLKVS